MNPLQELSLLSNALLVSVANEQHFAPIRSFVERMRLILTPPAQDLTREELIFLGSQIEKFFKSYRPLKNGVPYMPPVWASNNDHTATQIFAITNALTIISDDNFSLVSDSFLSRHNKTAKSVASLSKPPCVFIGHGQSKVWLVLEKYLKEDLGLKVVNYESAPRAGKSIVPILEEMLDKATFAVIVMTAEDDVASGEKRARQNVIHEAGLFQGRLGFGKAIVLLQRGCADFSNIDGLQYIPFTGDHVSEAFHELSKTLKREKQI